MRRAMMGVHVVLNHHLSECPMKRTLTYFAAAAASLALAACFPVVALAGHGHGDSHHGHGHGDGYHGHDHGNDRHGHNGDSNHRNDWAYDRGHGDRDDWDHDRGPRWAYRGGYGSSWYPGYGAYAGPRYGSLPNQCFDPRYGWYPCAGY